MAYQLSETDSVLKIEISDVGDQGPDLLASFRACQEGRCSCPTNEYEKLADLSVDMADGLIHLALTPADGARFDPTQIAACLDFTLQSAGIVPNRGETPSDPKKEESR